MDVASLCPLPVGLVRWESGRGPAAAVVVKLTLALGGERVTLAETQEPLTIDRPSEYGDDEDLYYPTDFVPRKARADLLLVGSAHAEVPTEAIPIRLRLSDFDKCAYALCAEASSWIPLSAAYLRATESSHSAPVMVGPRAPSSPERAALVRRVVMSEGGPPVAPLPDDFDFGFFNAAPPDQQLESLRLHAPLLLEGLRPDAPRRELKLPDQRPRIYCRAQAAGEAPMTEVRLRCDTLWIDVDRGLCTQTWRGALPFAGDALDSAELVVTASSHGSAESWASIEQRLGQAAVIRAVEASDLLAAAPAGAQAEAEIARRAKRQDLPAAIGVLRLGGARIGAARLIEREPPAKEEPDEEPTAIRVLAEESISDVPTHDQAEAEVRSAFPDDELTGEIDLARLQEARALPFQQSAAVPDWDDAGTEVDAPPLRPDLPFIGGPAVEPWPAPPASADMSALPFRPAAIQDVSAPAPPPKAPPPREDIPSLPLTQYAAIRIALWEGEELEEILHGNDIDEMTWRENEQRQAEALAEEAGAGRCDLALALAGALKAAGEQRARPADEGLTLDDYIALRVALDEAREAGPVLRARGIAAAAWQRLHRTWQQRARADAAVAAMMRAKIIEARRAGGAEP